MMASWAILDSKPTILYFVSFEALCKFRSDTLLNGEIPIFVMLMILTSRVLAWMAMSTTSFELPE